MIPPNLDILPARVSSDVFSPRVTTIKELCAIAQIPYKYVGGNLPYIGFSHGTGNLRAVDRNNHPVLVVDLDQFSERNSKEEALRVIEILAHAFHEYAARECARGLFGFSDSKVSGKRTQAKAAMTAAQRKAKQRARARDNGMCHVCLVKAAREDRATCAPCATYHSRTQRNRRSQQAKTLPMIAT